MTSKAWLAAIVTLTCIACSGDSSDDNQSTGLCGNGVLDAGETCDGNCPSSCPPAESCQSFTFTGSAESCDAQCAATPVTACSSGDGCCPDGCSTDTDTDCLEVQFVVGPFLQNASPEGITISWETDVGTGSRVDWGATESLGNTTEGTGDSSTIGTHMHDVALTGLTPNTRYFYRVSTGTAQSDVYDFITPPTRDSEQSFRLVAMSDMQRSSSNPNKFHEIIHEGVIDYISATHSDDIPAEIGFVLVPGDLVDDGWQHAEWAETFFAPAHDLMARVPFYPVLGNHEANTPHFFRYFQLPDNGPDDLKEHAWYFDYSNVRVIGLDSNVGFRNQAQLDWLESTLNDACSDDLVDFVFTELHHPHKSELWIDGEIDFTGNVISLLESFSTNCNKPSIHFFGHTHGYSRGQSRDHQHLWVNVATAGGGVDYWGEWAQRDYDEFSITTDDWGFVTLDVTAGDAPQFNLKRLSRGNRDQLLDNEERDAITIRRNNQAPQAPTLVQPLGANLCGSNVTVAASDFSDSDGDTHAASHWQVSYTCDDFSSPIKESWKQAENWYFNENTQAGDDLRDDVLAGIPAGGSYCWRVRYRDSGLVWSDWSDTAIFTTTDLGENLLLNPGAEDGTTGWTTSEGFHESLTNGECDGVAPHTGDKYFATGGVCESASFSKAYQEVTISEALWAVIDAGQAVVQFGGYLRTYNGSDLPELELEFIDASGTSTSSGKLSSQNSSWTYVSSSQSLPAGTRSIRFVLMGTRNAGNDSDCYFDDLSLVIGSCG